MSYIRPSIPKALTSLIIVAVSEMCPAVLLKDSLTTASPVAMFCMFIISPMLKMGTAAKSTRPYFQLASIATARPKQREPNVWSAEPKP